MRQEHGFPCMEGGSEVDRPRAFPPGQARAMAPNLTRIKAVPTAAR